MDGGRFRSWRRGRLPAAEMEHVPSPERRHNVVVPLGPEAVPRACKAVAGRFGEVGVVPGSAFADAVPDRLDLRLDARPGSSRQAGRPPDVVRFAEMTKDLALPISKDAPWVTMDQFLDALDTNLQKKIAG